MKKILILCLSCCLLFGASCKLINYHTGSDSEETTPLITNNIVNNVTNNITNEVTNKVVDSTLNYTVEDLEETVTECVTKLEDSIIGITLKGEVTYQDTEGHDHISIDAESTGSGVIYKRVELTSNKYQYRYYVITNSHVVTCELNHTYDHHVYAYIGKTGVKQQFKATVLGKDVKGDLAVITFDTDLYLPFVEFGQVENVKKGSFVVAIGNPDGYDYYNSVTFGVVSNLSRFISMDTDNDGTNDFSGEYIQTDAAINPGNSGGGLFTLDGKLIGINSCKLCSTKIDNMGFAIPSNIVKLEIENYLEKGLDYDRARFGITFVEVNEMTAAVKKKYAYYDIPSACYIDQTPYGLCVIELSEEGSLVNCGITAGDIVLKIRPKGTDAANDVILFESNDLSGLLNSIYNVDYQVGKEVTITYYEALTGTVKTVDITLITVK